MFRILILQVVFSFIAALPTSGGTVAEPCWRKICTGMTIGEVTRELRELDFRIDYNRMERLFQRLFPWASGGAMDFETYAFHISAQNNDTDVNLGFVRFPSGRKRLYSVSVTQDFKGGQMWVSDALGVLASALSVDVGNLGPPDTMEWEDWPAHRGDNQDRSLLRVVWSYEGGRRYFFSPAIKGSVLTNRPALLEGGQLEVPEEIHMLSAKSATVSFVSITAVAMEASSAWRAKEADWIVDVASGCKVWNNFPQGGDEEVRWSGECDKEGRATGLGVTTWFAFGTAKETDKGTFIAGKMNGPVSIEVGASYERKTTFSGEFKDNLPNGYGVLHRDGEKYEGDWKEGCLKVGKHSVAFFTHRDACNPF